eukprot:1146333-Pelagomonas_calceolata.AAC.5
MQAHVRSKELPVRTVFAEQEVWKPELAVALLKIQSSHHLHRGIPVHRAQQPDLGCGSAHGVHHVADRTCARTF